MWLRKNGCQIALKMLQWSWNHKLLCASCFIPNFCHWSFPVLARKLHLPIWTVIFLRRWKVLMFGRTFFLFFLSSFTFLLWSPQFKNFLNNYVHSCVWITEEIPPSSSGDILLSEVSLRILTVYLSIPFFSCCHGADLMEVQMAVNKRLWHREL